VSSISLIRRGSSGQGSSEVSLTGGKSAVQSIWWSKITLFTGHCRKPPARTDEGGG